MRSILVPLLESTTKQLLWTLLFYVPVGIVCVWVVLSRRAYESEAKEPFTDLPLRPPGESSRKMADDLFEKAVGYLLGLLALSGMSGFVIATAPAGHKKGLIIILGAFVLVSTAGLGFRIIRLIHRSWNWRLGCKGERVVAEELNQLLPHGFRVFHDVPFEGFNVDHVAVGPSGVFVVETKTRRKRKARGTQSSHVVRYDGDSLTWPNGFSDAEPIHQAERNARTVSVWLGSATGERVTCRPVVTIPGWFVERTEAKPARVIVATSKHLHRFLASFEPNKLSAAQVQRISHQLSERCALTGEVRERHKAP